MISRSVVGLYSVSVLSDYLSHFGSTLVCFLARALFCSLHAHLGLIRPPFAISNLLVVNQTMSVRGNLLVSRDPMFHQTTINYLSALYHTQLHCLKANPIWTTGSVTR